MEAPRCHQQTQLFHMRIDFVSTFLIIYKCIYLSQVSGDLKAYKILNVCFLFKTNKESQNSLQMLFIEYLLYVYLSIKVYLYNDSYKHI